MIFGFLPLRPPSTCISNDHGEAAKHTQVQLGDGHDGDRRIVRKIAQRTPLLPGDEHWWRSRSQLFDRRSRDRVELLDEPGVERRVVDKPLHLPTRDEPTSRAHGNEVRDGTTADGDAHPMTGRDLRQDPADVVPELTLRDLSFWIGHATSVARRACRSVVSSVWGAVGLPLVPALEEGAPKGAAE
jgi:hypothetical protein